MFGVWQSGGRRRAAAVGALTVALALGVVSQGTADTVSLDDPPDDGSSPDCEILNVAVQHSGKRIEHSITLAEPTGVREGSHVVLIQGSRGNLSPDLVLSPGASGVKTEFSNGDLTVTYSIKAKKLRKEAELSKRKKKYFWVANACSINPDWAPSTATGDPQLTAHAFRAGPG